MKHKACIISIDEFKKQIPGYNPKKSEEFHEQSARLADKEFEKTLKTTKYSNVILMSGGSASGKTEYIASQLFDEDAIIFDSTLSSEKGAEIKLHKAEKANKQVEIIAIIPDDLSRAFSAFLSRDRKFKEEHFFRTHAGSRKTLLWIAKNHPEADLKIIINSFKKKLKYQRISQPEKHISIIKKLQITEEEIRGIIYDRIK